MEKLMSWSSRPFTRSQRSKLLLCLPDHIMQMVFDPLSTKHAAILSSVNAQLRDFALAHTPASWADISIELPDAKKLNSLLIFLSKLPTNAKSLELYIESNAIDINALQIFPVLPNVDRLILSRNRWLECDHLELLANRMPAVTQLESDDCLGLKVIHVNWPDGCLEIVDRHYGRQLRVFSCSIQGLGCYPGPGDNAMVRLMSHSSNLIKFSFDDTCFSVPNPVIFSMLNRSPDIRELLCEDIRADAETQTFLFALSACGQLTHLSLTFATHAQTAMPLKPWAFRAAFDGLTKLKILKLFFKSGILMESEDGENEGQIQNLPFQLDILHIESVFVNLYQFFRRLVLSQIEYLDTLILHAPDCTDMFAGLFAHPRPSLRELSISSVDYLSEHFTPPLDGYRHIFNHTPALELLSAVIKNNVNDDDNDQILHVLAREYPHCEVVIDCRNLSAETRLAIAAGSVSE